MKLISLLITLLIIGLLIKNQLNPSSPIAEHGGTVSSQPITVPNVPTEPKEIQQFEKDMNNFISETAEKRAKGIEE